MTPSGRQPSGRLMDIAPHDFESGSDDVGIMLALMFAAVLSLVLWGFVFVIILWVLA